MSTDTKTFWQKFFKEIKSIALTTLYFALWFGILLLLKKLILEDYQIEFSGISMALIGALILAKVVLLMNYIPHTGWTHKHSAIFFIIFRTLLYTSGVLIVMLLEKAFESRHEAGGFGSALIHVFQDRDIYRVWAGIIVVSLSLFWFNVLSVLQQYFGEHKLRQLFFSIPIADLQSKHIEQKTAAVQADTKL